MCVLRVAQVIGIANDGGVESCIMNAYRHIDRTRVQFDFLVESESKIINRQEIEAMGGRVILIPPYTRIFRYLSVLQTIFRENRYDIVHSNMSTLNVFPLYAAARAGIPVRVSHSHTTANKKEWKKTFLKWLLRPFAKVFATDYAACSELAGRFLFGNRTYDQGRVTLLQNAVDTDRFRYDPVLRKIMRRQLGLTDCRVYGHIGRMVPQKNQLFLLEVFAELKKRQKNAVLLLLGDGSLRPQLEKYIEEHSLSDSVLMPGTVKNPEAYYQAMDAFLLPSLYEGLPVVGVEAQVSGLPSFFSTEVTKEVKRSETVTFLPLSLPPVAWADRILAVPEPDRAAIGKAFADSGFDIRRAAVRMMEFYERIRRDRPPHNPEEPAKE